MHTLLRGEKIELRPAVLQDKWKVFDWLTNSNLTKEMLGPPNYPDATIPGWNEFTGDYRDHFFDGSDPINGRCFIIMAGDLEVGQINYNEIDIDNQSTYLDIWLSDRKYTGRGIGTQAILLLCDYLNAQFNCKSIMLAPSGRNINAIKAYAKAGFVMSDIELDETEKDYDDIVVLIKEMS